ncbi:interaptin-like [Amblyraja radiata]|uniref:interaptin-like n=1 Tax=Amblyraja radiata TaxID=386614 RepID=UPI001403EEF4|nr:interaptin-like [Amblyraja radiata]
MENEELKDKLLAEKHGMRTKVRNMTEKHEADFKKLNRKHRTQLRKIREKHAEETSLKDQCYVQLNKDLQLLQSHACAPLAEQATCSLNDYTKQKIGELEEQVRLMTQEAEKSEARFITMEAQSKLKINQIEEELDNVQIVPSRQELLELKDIAVDLEEENEQLHLKLNWLQHVEAQNEDLQAKLEEYEEQHQNMQADLEQATKGQTSQTSESESAEELHSRLMKWRETVYKPTPSHDIDERNVMELRMRQLEEEREDLISELQELEEELGELQRRGQDQGWTKQTTAGQKLMEKEELETLQQTTQQERREQDPSSCKNELAELRHGPLLVRPAPREQTIEVESIEECEEALEIDPSEQVVVARKVKSRVNFFKRLFTTRK